MIDSSKVSSFCITIFIYVLTEVVDCSSPKVLLISVDGFRYNYLDLLAAEETPNFHYFIQNGVKSELVNVFPTNTYPNHYTLITGLYPESHGIVQNRFFDKDFRVKDFFWYDNRRDNFDPVWYDVGAEPIYVTNKKGSGIRKCGSILWPGGLGKVKGVEPEMVYEDKDPFSHVNFTKMFDDMVDWFTMKDNPINLGLLYFDEPDELAHKFGAGSLEVIKFIKEFDGLLGHFINKLKDTGLINELNIILVADHGFTNITEHVVFTDYEIWEHEYTTGSHFQNRAALQMYPKDSSIEVLYKKLTNDTLRDKIDVYLRDRSDYLRSKLHFSASSRIAPIIVTGKEGIVLFPNKSATQNYTNKGGHGYDPLKFRNMHPIFLAMGPVFKKRVEIPAFPNLDIYPLMCHILGVEPAPNNGTLESVRDILVDSVSGNRENLITGITSVSLLVVFGMTVLIAGLYAICACHNARKKPRIIVRRLDGPTNHLHTHHLLQSDDDDDEF